MIFGNLSNVGSEQITKILNNCNNLAYFVHIILGFHLISNICITTQFGHHLVNLNLLLWARCLNIQIPWHYFQVIFQTPPSSISIVTFFSFSKFTVTFIKNSGLAFVDRPVEDFRPIGLNHDLVFVICVYPLKNSP